MPDAQFPNFTHFQVELSLERKEGNFDASNYSTPR